MRTAKALALSCALFGTMHAHAASSVGVAKPGRPASASAALDIVIHVIARASLALYGADASAPVRSITWSNAPLVLSCSLEQDEREVPCAKSDPQRPRMFAARTRLWRPQPPAVRVAGPIARLPIPRHYWISATLP